MKRNSTMNEGRRKEGMKEGRKERRKKKEGWKKGGRKEFWLFKVNDLI